MRNLDSRASRRRFLVIAGSGAIAVPLTVLLPATVRGAELPKLDLEDPSAKALGYVHESTTAGQLCSNCNFWQSGDAEWGGCPLFPGKSVAAKGWCKSWVKKA